MNFLRSRPAQLLSLLLIAQACMIGVVAPAEKVPLSRPLSGIPKDLNGWTMVQEGVIDAETMELLRADDTVTRSYLAPDRRTEAGLFIAFFKSQRAGVAPHSPKVCLPGAGYEFNETDTISVAIPGRAVPIVINRNVVSKGEERSLVMYWYQTPYRVIASELTAKFYTMVDGLRYHRSDASLVRVIVPIGASEEEAEIAAVRFIQGFFNQVSSYLPS